ncbi:MAG: Rad52/Rad22 family DNA repair protein [Blastocatellia bacterium]
MRSKETVADTTAEQTNEQTKDRVKSDTEGRKAANRDKRAQSLAAMGLVTREGSRYYVKSAAARGRQESYEVWRDETGRVCCSCAEFERLTADAPAFRCEHILAVKYSLTANKEEHDMNGEEKEVAQSAQTEPEPEVAQSAQTEAEPEVARPAQTEAEPNEATAPQPAQVVPMSFANLLRTLRQPIDSRLIKTREGWTDRQGNTHWVEYIEWHTVADILDRVAPNWSHAVRNITQVGDLVAVTASITIGGVTREGIGTGSAENETGIKKAEHDALKRAAVKFGIARDLYRRESEVIEEDGIAPGILRDPRPKTLGDLITPKQLWMIRSLGREAGCDVEQECQSLMQCNLEEISKRAASSLIDYLKRRGLENQPEELRRAS